MFSGVFNGGRGGIGTFPRRISQGQNTNACLCVNLIFKEVIISNYTKSNEVFMTMAKIPINQVLAQTVR